MGHIYIACEKGPSYCGFVANRAGGNLRSVQGSFREKTTMKFAKIACVTFLTMLCGPVTADENTVRIGILTDMSGQLSDYTGAGAVEAARMAVADYGGKVNGKPIEIIFADHQLKADVALGILRQWYDTRGVDAVVDLTLSNIALAAQNLTREKNKVALLIGAATVELYREKCSPNSVDWAVDNYTYGNAVPKIIMKKGGKKWFLLVTDYAFGYNLQELTSAAVKSSGGEIVGVVRHPLNTSDYSSFLLQAQGTGADVLAFINSNMDLANSLKQAREFGLDKKMQFVAPANAIHSVIALGLEASQGMTVVDPAYWNVNDETRAFSKRFQDKMNKPPTGGQFLAYGAVLHYLKGVEAAGGPSDGAAVVDKMKSIPVSDVAFKGKIRADGRVLYDMLVSRVKSPSESKGPFDVYDVVGKIPASEAFAPIEGSPCPMLK
jgi:branched-chain amino acid transport system substrate-binding protein